MPNKPSTDELLVRAQEARLVFRQLIAQLRPAMIDAQAIQDRTIQIVISARGDRLDRVHEENARLRW